MFRFFEGGEGQNLENNLELPSFPGFGWQHMDVVNVDLAVLEWAAVTGLPFIFSWNCPDIV